MVLAVIVHEVEKPKIRKTTLTQSGRFFEWFEGSELFASVGLRQFGQGSSGLLRNAKVYVAPEEPDQLKFLISNGSKLNLLCHVIFSDQISENKVNDLRRPGVSVTSGLASKLGLQLKADVNIYSTVASMESELTSSGNPSNGWLVFEDSKIDTSILLATLLLTAVGVGVERSILNNAQTLVASERHNLFVYQPILHRLRAWSALPPIDSSYLASKYLELRDSLFLSLRREEITRSLELKERNLAVLIGLITAVLGVIATFALSKI